MIKCSKCKEIKDLTHFNKNENGTQSYCKVCQNAYSRAWFHNNRERAERLHKTYRDANPSKRREGVLKYKYGINLDDYQKLSEQYNNLCAICNKPETKKYKGQIVDLSVDHNHITGEIRGLLCNACNVGIGLLESDKGIELLEKAIKYILKESK